MPVSKTARLANAVEHFFANPKRDHDQAIDEGLAGDHDDAGMVIKTVTGLCPIEQRNHLAQNQYRDCRPGERGELDIVLREEELDVTKIRWNATKKKSTTGAISRIKPNSPPSIDADAVVSRARKVRFMTETMAPCVSLNA